MPLASSGLLRPLLSRAPNQLLHRSIHIPPLPRPTLSQRAARTARSYVSAFIGHLSTPGTLRAPIQSSARGVSHAATRVPGIKQGLSLPARHALARPLGTPHLPRAPVVPRSVSQVGLGTARSFGTARPIFQSLAENVPVGVRALIEAELGPHQAKKAGIKPVKMTKKASSSKGKQMMKENTKPRTTSTPTHEQELEHYFPTTALSAVVTHVIIPLSPNASQASSGRRPLWASPAESMPLPELAAMHASYGTHSLRVSSLFMRLDQARIWEDPTVRCTTEAFGDDRGTCTTLRVTFEGWTEHRVRQLLGEAGKGWCEIIQEDMEEELDSVLDQQEIYGYEDCLGRDESLSVHTPVDPAQSLVLPTIDLSASMGVTSTRSTSSDDLLSWLHSPEPRSEDVLSDYSLSDSDSENGEDAAVYSLAPASASASWVGLGFSSRFVDAMEHDTDSLAPKEYLF